MAKNTASDRNTNRVILFGIGGILYAILVLTWGQPDHSFHDFYLINKKVLVKTEIESRIADLQQKEQTKEKDHAAAADSLKASLIIELNNLAYVNADTSLSYFANYFSANRETYRRSLVHMNDTIATVHVLLAGDNSGINDTLPVHEKILELGRRKYDWGMVGFFDNYPLFGFWFIIALVQAALWFTLFPLLIGSVCKTDHIVQDCPYNFKNAVSLSLFPLLVMIFFALIYNWLMHRGLVNDNYFMEDYNLKMRLYSIPVFFTAVICFGIYLFLARKLDLLNKDAKEQNVRLLPESDLQAHFMTLKTSFNFAFACSAVVLSLYVLWIGILFNAMNGLEAFRFYTLLSGKTFFNYNFIYYAGILCSLVLLIFYTPVRLKFNSLQITRDQKIISSSEGGFRKLIESFWDSIGSILITASPILTTVLHKLISGLISG